MSMRCRSFIRLSGYKIYEFAINEANDYYYLLRIFSCRPIVALPFRRHSVSTYIWVYRIID